MERNVKMCDDARKKHKELHTNVKKVHNVLVEIKERH